MKGLLETISLTGGIAAILLFIGFAMGGFVAAFVYPIALVTKWALA